MPTRATTPGIARAGIGRSPLNEHASWTGDDGSPSDCPLLYVMPTRSMLSLSPAEQPTSISPTALAPARRAASAIAGYSGAALRVKTRLLARGDGHDRVGHSHERVDRRAGGGVAVPSGIGRGKRRGPSGEGEVVQRREDQRGVPLARRRRLDGAQGLVGLTDRDRDALVQR